MGLSSAGIGSNLPIDSIISQLMTLEQRPLTSLDRKVASYQAKLSAMGTIKGALSTFQTAIRGLSDISKFQAVSATMGDATVAGASASAKATIGSYSLEVSKLAQAQKLATAGQASASTPIGTGTITFDLGTISTPVGASFDAASGKYTGASFASAGSGLKTVTIDPANSSLTGIRDAINKAGVGVTASIINDGSGTPHRLVLTEAATGKASSMKISVAGDPGLQTLLNHDPADAAGQALSETVTAQNAEFKLDGIAVSSATNTPANMIEGVTLTLSKTNVGNPTSLVIARDTATVVASVGQFVSAYNAINKTLKDLTAYNEATKVGAVLNGDSTVRGIQTQLRSLLSSPIAGGGTAFSVLSDIGVTVKAGIMAVDDAKLKKTIDSNFSDIAGLFAAVGKPSDSLVTFKSATAGTAPGSYAVNVSAAATRGATVSSAAAGPITTSNNTIDVLLDGITSTVTLEPGAYADPATLAAEVQSKINGVAAFANAGSSVSVTQVNGFLTITSNRYGSASKISLSGAGASNLVGGAAGTSGTDVVGTIGGVAAAGSGRSLTGAAGSAAEGLALLLDGDGTGARGTVNYSQGYAFQFDRFVTALLDTTSPLAARTDGINASLKTMEAGRLRMVDRLADTEKRLRAQYTALDVTISRMNTTSSYLAQQLAQLSNLSN